MSSLRAVFRTIMTSDPFYTLVIIVVNSMLIDQLPRIQNKWPQLILLTMKISSFIWRGLKGNQRNDEALVSPVFFPAPDPG